MNTLETLRNQDPVIMNPIIAIEVIDNLTTEFLYQFNMKSVLVNNPEMIEPMKKFIEACKVSRK